MRMHIFGVPIDSLSREEILASVRGFLSQPEPRLRRIVTVNPEFLLRAEQDPLFRQALLTADMRVVDGFGIVLLGWLRGQKIARFPGVDLMHEILHRAEESHLLVYLAMKKGGLSSYEETKAALSEKYPNLIVHGSDIDGQEIATWNLRIRNSAIIFCNFGIPLQETFLAHAQNSFPEARLAMGVGGSFDYLTGKLPRAPKVLRAVGLEWLWRLMLQPKRFKRIWNAVVVFPYTYLKQKENRER